MTERTALTAIVLAAGRSTRMQSRNKLLLPWGDKRMLQVVLDTLFTVPFEKVVVVVGHERRRVEQLLQGYALCLVHNERYAEGMSTSIRKGVEAVEDPGSGYLLALGDMPWIKQDTVERLCVTFPRSDPRAIALPTVGRRRGHPVIFGKYYRRELLQLEGDRGAASLLQKHAEMVVEVPVDDSGIFKDVDTPEAYRPEGFAR